MLRFFLSDVGFAHILTHFDPLIIGHWLRFFRLRGGCLFPLSKRSAGTRLGIHYFLLCFPIEKINRLKTQLATRPQGENTPQDNPKNGPYSRITAQQ